MVNSARFVFFLRVNGFGDVLVTLISILEFVTVDRELATTSWCSPEYGSVGLMIPVVFVRVRRLMPASIVTHWSGMMVSWVLVVTLWYLEIVSLSSAEIAYVRWGKCKRA